MADIVERSPQRSPRHGLLRSRDDDGGSRRRSRDDGVGGNRRAGDIEQGSAPTGNPKIFPPIALMILVIIGYAGAIYCAVMISRWKGLMVTTIVVYGVKLIVALVLVFHRPYIVTRDLMDRWVLTYRVVNNCLKSAGSIGVITAFVFLSSDVEKDMKNLRFFALGFFLSCYLLVVSVAKLFSHEDIFGTADCLMAVIMMLWNNNDTVILEGFKSNATKGFWFGFYAIHFLVNLFKLTEIKLIDEPENAGSNGGSSRGGRGRHGGRGGGGSHGGRGGRGGGGSHGGRGGRGGGEGGEDEAAPITAEPTCCQRCPEGCLRRMESGIQCVFRYPVALMILVVIGYAGAIGCAIKISHWKTLMVTMTVFFSLLVGAAFILLFHRAYISIRACMDGWVLRCWVLNIIIQSAGAIAVLTGFVYLSNDLEKDMEKLRFFALGFFLSCFVLIVSVAKLFRAHDILGTADSLMAVLITIWIKNNQVILQGFNVGEKICFWVGFYVILFLVNFFKLTKIQLREPEPAGSDGTSLENPAGGNQGAQATTTAPEGGGEKQAPGQEEDEGARDPAGSDGTSLENPAGGNQGAQATTTAPEGGGEKQAPEQEEDEGARDPAGSDGTSLLENPAGGSQGAQATTTVGNQLAPEGGGEKQAPGQEEDEGARDPAGSDGTSLLENPAGGSQGAQATTTVGNQLAIGRE